MKIDAALSPLVIDHLPEEDLSTTTCVIFDVLRATSSIVTALASGAISVHPVATIDEAKALAATLPTAFLGGERNGDPIPGFDLGNSPEEFLGTRGRPVVITTTNGTVALRACAGAERLLAASFLNLSATVGWIAREKPKRLLLVCAGTFRGVALEDVAAAGALIDQLDGRGLIAAADCTDAARVALATYRSNRDHLADFLATTDNGRLLTAARRERDITWCAVPDRFALVAEMRDGALRPAS